MVEVQLFDRLRATALRKRWTIGLSIDSRCRQLRAALVGAEGNGLSSRAAVMAHRRLAIDSSLTAQFRRLRRNRGGPGDAALLAAQLAESQAMLLEQFAAEIAPVWDRVLAVAVDDPGLWRHWSGLTGYTGLCDAARLADLTGHNVIDSFPARDLAQGGRGRPLSPVPCWMLLHDSQKTRVLVRLGRAMHLTWLPASRDSSGASRVLHVTRKRPVGNAAEWAAAVGEALQTQLPRMPPVEELVLSAPSGCAADFGNPLTERLPSLRVIDATGLGMSPGTLGAACVALLGHLHLDQVPANTSATTGVRTPRVLGHLTPGSPQSWHRLVRELAAAKPSVISLRSAI